VGRNQDDHTKNFGFLMNKKGEWSLSPAFDMTYSYDPSGTWTKVHQIRLNKKQDNFTKEDIISFGKYCNLTKIQSIKILEKTIEVFKEFEELADKYKVPKKLKETVSKNLRRDLI
jgi:serine/threonine-protein kinase HipA